MENKCPACPKKYQSEKDLRKHCRRFHDKSLEELRKEKEAMNQSMIKIKGWNA